MNIIQATLLLIAGLAAHRFAPYYMRVITVGRFLAGNENSWNYFWQLYNKNSFVRLFLLICVTIAVAIEGVFPIDREIHKNAVFVLIIAWALWVQIDIIRAGLGARRGGSLP